jgi:hypothetical protein
MIQTDTEKRKEYNKIYYQKNKCEHNRKKSTCKECGGASICEHNRVKSQCKECGGSSICEHNRIKSQCKECGGSSICEHNRIKSKCKECGGSQICEHNRRKSQCKECGGSSICEHNREKSRCKECGGSQICEHNRLKSQCKECGGSQICEHNRLKSQCKECNPLLYLVHLQRGNIYRIMNQTNITKSKPSIEYLGCSVEYFREYIKSKMREDMNFDNIHYDHIKPICAFDLYNEEEMLSCCHYTNFQPLLAVDNLVKNGKWTKEDDLFWKKNICGKEYLPLFIPK